MKIIISISTLLKKIQIYASKQERIFTILNTPAHNPTGYSVPDDDWDKILDLSKEVAKNPEKKNNIICRRCIHRLCKR